MQAGQPCLIGTVSIESSEQLSRLLDKRGIKHETLNAKNHEREAHIVAQAGRVGAVTIATNMAGRGTDILLGGNPDVLAERRAAASAASIPISSPAEPADGGGLPTPTDAASARRRSILRAQRAKPSRSASCRRAACASSAPSATSRRRIDNQLRGRAGRQGDPGTTQFYLSLEDDLMRLFGGSTYGQHRRHDGEDQHARRHAHPGIHGVKGHRERAAPG